MLPIEIYYIIADYLSPKQLPLFFKSCSINLKKYLKNRHVIFNNIHEFLYIYEEYQDTILYKLTIKSILSTYDVSLLYNIIVNYRIYGTHLDIRFYWKGTSLIQMSLIGCNFLNSTLYVHTYPKKMFRYNLLVLLNVLRSIPKLTLHLVNGLYIIYDPLLIDNKNISSIYFYENDISKDNMYIIQNKLTAF
jgi:hypothetical protein